MLQKLHEENLAPHKDRLEKKYYEIVQEGSLKVRNINTVFFYASNCGPNILCSRLAFLLGEATSSQTNTNTNTNTNTTSPVRMATVTAPKKMTPKRKLNIR
jgi:hypothetical protein